MEREAGSNRVSSLGSWAMLFSVTLRARSERREICTPEPAARTSRDQYVAAAEAARTPRPRTLYMRKLSPRPLR